MSIKLTAIENFLNEYLDASRYAEPCGVYVDSARPVARLGLALEPSDDVAEWINGERLDALFLHRPWKLERAPTALPEGVGVIAYHLAFDERLTLGYNPRLAQALRLSGLEVLGEKEGRPLGMSGDVSTLAAMTFTDFARAIGEVFGGCERNDTPTSPEVTRVAVVGAMTDALVREASARGAQVYVTGQFRAPAEAAVKATNIGVIAVGHRRSEEWGLRALAGVLRERWCDLQVIFESRKGASNEPVDES